MEARQGQDSQIVQLLVRQHDFDQAVTAAREELARNPQQRQLVAQLSRLGRSLLLPHRQREEVVAQRTHAYEELEVLAQCVAELKHEGISGGKLVGLYEKSAQAVSRGEQLAKKQSALSEKRLACQREKERLQEELAAAEQELKEERVAREIRGKQLHRLLQL